MNSLKKLFPIGSVVSLKNIEGRVMIIGHMQQQEGTETVWDYASVPYPVGLIDPSKFLLFNQDKIMTLYYIGLQDKEGLDYMRQLTLDINNINISEQEDKQSE